MHDELNELQRDALTETFNIGAGRASRSLSQLAGGDVALSVPVITQVEPGELGSIISPKLFGSPDVCVVSRRVPGIDADLAMIFQASQDACTSALSPDVSQDSDPTDKDPREVFATKIGYLVIESCLDQVENVIGRSIDRQPLVYSPTISPRVFSDGFVAKEPLIIVKIDLALIKHGISTHLVAAMTHKAANRLADGLDRLIEQSVEG